MARILVVDDEEEVRDAVADLLRAFGHEVEMAAGGHEAVLVLEAGGRFDGVLTDRRMPRVGGEEVLRAARRLLPAAKLVLMTGDNLSETDMAVAIAAGANEILRKPFSVEEFSQLLTRLFP